MIAAKMGRFNITLIMRNKNKTIRIIEFFAIALLSPGSAMADSKQVFPQVKPQLNTPKQQQQPKDVLMRLRKFQEEIMPQRQLQEQILHEKQLQNQQKPLHIGK